MEELLAGSPARDELCKLAKEFDIKDECVEEGDLIGGGYYGEVYRGVLRIASGAPFQVVLKRLKHGDPQSIVELLKEASVMNCLDHPNILKIIGISILRGKPNIVMPLMARGNLNSFLRDLRYRGSVSTINRADLLKFCTQTCDGMVYMSERNFIHRDLACRNVLSDDNLMPKISDFGLARNIDQREYYCSGMPDRPLPIAWHPPESWLQHMFDTKSDVWSFGVVVWEIYSWGEKPYLGLSNTEIMTFVNNGSRLARPRDCPEYLYQQVILPCWLDDRSARPSFRQLQNVLASFCL